MCGYLAPKDGHGALRSLAAGQQCVGRESLRLGLRFAVSGAPFPNGSGPLHLEEMPRQFCWVGSAVPGPAYHHPNTPHPGGDWQNCNILPMWLGFGGTRPPALAPPHIYPDAFAKFRVPVQWP